MEDIADVAEPMPERMPFVIPVETPRPAVDLLESFDLLIVLPHLSSVAYLSSFVRQLVSLLT